MSRNLQVTRLLKILGVLSNRKSGTTVGELSHELNVSPRTIYRDFDALQEAGFPLYSSMEEGTNAIWRFVDGYRYQVPIPFSLTELMGLYFCRGLMKPLTGTVFEKTLTSAMEKVKMSLSEEAFGFLQKVENSLSAGVKGGGNYSRYRQLINLLNQAAMNGETLSLNYFSYSTAKTTTRLVDPYKLYYFEGTLYLIGFCHKAQDVRTFAVERIKLADKSDNTFTPPKNFSVEEYFKDSFGVFRQELVTVKIRFDSIVAPFLTSKEWHASQEIQPARGGAVILTLRLAGTQEVKNWVMGFSDHAEVLEPETLRSEIANKINKMSQVYRSGQSASQKIHSL